jgi:hypothetical protein
MTERSNRFFTHLSQIRLATSFRNPVIELLFASDYFFCHKNKKPDGDFSLSGFLLGVAQDYSLKVSFLSIPVTPPLKKDIVIDPHILLRIASDIRLTIFSNIVNFFRNNFHKLIFANTFGTFLIAIRARPDTHLNCV